MARLNARRTTFSPGRSSSISSDQENQEPDATTKRRDKGKGRATMSDAGTERTSLPTPSSDSSEAARGQKRKRTGGNATQADDIPSDMDQEDEKFTRYFDPNQNWEQRRQVKKKSRALQREFHDTRDELLRGDGDSLKATINRANNVFKNIKQTTDATIDSRLFVDVSNLALKKSSALVSGDRSAGVDVDEFLRKAVSYMKNNGPLNAEQQAATSTQRRRARSEDEDDEEDEGGPLDWEVFGLMACFPYNSRPACPSFLLGPLSLQKKQRKQTQRTARQVRDPNAREARPEALSRADIRADENTLTATCTRIKIHLDKHCKTQVALMKERFRGRGREVNTPEGQAWLKEHRITLKQGPYLFDYAVNPDSFGQTVENLFYISFLIKEGNAGIQMDDSGLPVLTAAEPTNVEQKRAAKSTRRQAVFSLDYSNWKSLIDSFDITESMIPHRSEEQASQVGQGGWYT